MKTLLLNIFQGRYILKSMVVKDIKSRFTGSVLGPLWIVATPLYQMLLYTFLFSVILRVRFEEGAESSSFAVYLLAGLIPWIFFSESTSRGISSFIDNAHIIKKVKFPIELCVVSMIVSSMFTFFIYMIFYSAMLIFDGLFKVQTFFFFIVPFIIEVLLALGLSLGLGSIAVFFRDITQAVGMALNLVFFLVPLSIRQQLFPHICAGSLISILFFSLSRCTGMY